MPINKENRNLSIEILKYAKETRNYSFYELKAYAYDKRPDWLPMFEDKKFRECLSAYCKSARYSKHIKVRSTYEAMKICLDAEERYYKKHLDKNEF